VNLGELFLILWRVAVIRTLTLSLTDPLQVVLGLTRWVNLNLWGLLALA